MRDDGFFKALVRGDIDKEGVLRHTIRKNVTQVFRKLVEFADKMILQSVWVIKLLSQALISQLKVRITFIYYEKRWRIRKRDLTAAATCGMRIPMKLRSRLLILVSLFGEKEKIFKSTLIVAFLVHALLLQMPMRRKKW